MSGSASIGIKALTLNMKVDGGEFVVHPVLLWDEQERILVDTGIPGQLELIAGVLEQEGVPLGKLSRIIITHQDRDHIGSLPELVKATGGSVQVLAHEEAVPYLAGELPLLKSQQLAPPVRVDTVLRDGDLLPYAGGIRVIFTPGHTPDHISLYHLPSKTLITGDALTSRDGVLLPFDSGFTLDHKTALASVAQFEPLELDTVVTYHGGVCTERIDERLREILAGASA
ncbi:MBL fold metallo-hydrolase [Paenibacillus tengchongensis]|uniref:MBL fold metallo-hydrolase n=1 Tax=Paenibacillus tengchongensis TaxID=2608684 RepID=UPI001FE7EADF|nr:MBL fold metallo-hydrolase [Paenibacillus tengchongensis]